MSVFKVKLQYPGKQGYLDLDPSSACSASPAEPSCLGTLMDPSIQRTIFVTGPNLIYRQLFDGETFTDCNYWKRYAFPNVTQEQAFIEVLTDDGSIFSDNAEENTFPLVFGGASAYTVAAADTFATNFIDIIGGFGGFARFVQIQNFGTASPSQDIKVQFNGATTAIMSLAAGATQIFNAGDVNVSRLGFEGGSADTDIQVILSVTVECTS